MPLFPSTPKERKQQRNEPYSPLGQRFHNQFEIEQAARRKAAGQVHQKLNPLREEGIEEGQAHQGRLTDLGQNYDYMNDRVSEAYQNAQKALDNVLTSSTSTDEATSGAFAAALAKAREGDNAEAGRVGGVLPAGNDQAAEQAQTAGSQNVLGMLGANLGATGATLAQGGVRAAQGRVRAIEDEDQRNAAKQAEIQKLKRGVKSEAPALEEEAREQLENSALAGQTEKNREKIAKGSLHIEGRNATTAEKEQAENARHDKAEEGISWGAINAEKQKYRREVETATAGAEKEQAEAHEAKYNAAVDTYQEYIGGHKPNQVIPKELFHSLRLQVGAQVAKKIMESSSNPKIKEWLKGPAVKAVENAAPHWP